LRIRIRSSEEINLDEDPKRAPHKDGGGLISNRPERDETNVDGALIAVGVLK
jgi:hypothetical protein